MKNYKMNEKLQKSHFLFRGFLSKQSKDIEKTRETILCTSRVRSRLEILSRAFLKCGFLKKSYIMNAPLVSCPFPVIVFGCVQQQTHPKVMTGNGQLTRGAFIINDFIILVKKGCNKQNMFFFFHWPKVPSLFKLCFSFSIDLRFQSLFRLCFSFSIDLRFQGL